MGRPTLYCDELKEKILERMVCGENLTQICKDDDMPAISSVLLWMSKNPSFSEAYTRAREIMLENYGSEKLIDIADSASLTAEAINKARLQIDSRKWVMSKLLPRKYGDNAVLTHTGKVEVEQLIIQRTPKTIDHQPAVKELPVIDIDKVQ